MGNQRPWIQFHSFLSHAEGCAYIIEIVKNKEGQIERDEESVSEKFGGWEIKKKKN